MSMWSQMMANESWQEGELFKWHGAELIFIPLMMVTGIVGNVLVFYIYHFQWRNNTVTLIKRMLAVLDLVSLLLVHPALLYMTIFPHSISFNATCIFTSVVALGTAISSGCVLIIIAADRFMRLCLLRKKGVGPALSKRLFAASVVFACVINIPCGWSFEKNIIFFRAYNVQVTECFISTDDKLSTIIIMCSALLSSVFLIVYCTLIVLYYKIVKKLKQLGQKHDQLRYSASLTRRSESIRIQQQSEVMRDSAIVFIAITVVFFASNFPYLVTLVLSLTHSSADSGMSPALKAVYDMAKLSPLVNNMANPLVYSFTSKVFREEVMRTLTFKTCNSSFFQRRVCSLRCTSQDISMSTISRID